MARIKRSAKDLWSLVTSSPVSNSKDLILYELEENSDRILNGILFISKFNQTSLDALKKSVEDAHFEFISKLSKLIDIDSMQCYELFISYATYEYKGTQKTLEAQLLSERHMQSLLMEVWQYYFGERLYYLLILKHILSHWQDEADPNKEIYEKFLDKINKDKAVLYKIINQIEVSISTELPSKDTNGPYMTDLLAYHWVTFILKEQCELLQLLLLYYKVIEPTISDVKKLVSLFQAHGFGSRQSFRFMFSDENQHFVDLIGYLEGFVLIQCFEMELLFKFKENGMLGEHYLLKDEKALLELNNSIHNLGSHQSHSPVLLCWLLISQCSEVPEMGKGANKLGKTALQLDVFEYLKTAVSSPEFSRKGVISDTVNSIVYNLLSIVLSQFELQNLGSVQPLYSIATSVLKCKSVADDFWEQEEKSGIRELFNYCIEMFSIEFCPLLNMCSSLASVNKESCIKVVQTIQKLPVFTEILENIDERDVIATQEPNIWELIKDRTLYGDHSITLPKGTLGIVIKETDKDSSSVIQWQVDVNGWQICLRELYFKLQEMSFSSALIPVESIKRMITVGKLVKNILETAPEMRFQLSHILNAMFSILQRHISSTSPSLELISVCIDIAAILSRDEMSDVWQQLSQIRLLPFMTNIPKNVMDRVSGICMNIGIIGQLIASRECISGEYSVCLAFLNLVLNVSKNSTSENEIFLACVVYIMREIFSYFHKWYYSEPNQRLLMGQKCLQLLHNLFPMDKHKIKSLGEAQELCIYSLLNFEAGQTLLKIVCTGEEVVQQTVLKQNSELGEEVASMIRLSLSVLNRLLLLRNNFCMKSSKTEVSPLEAVLFSTPGHTTQPQVVLMVAHYAFQRYNPHLAILAIQLLKRFAKEFPMSLLACFGSEAEAIRDHFLARLCFQYENVRLKVAILEFLTVCVAQQPGLIEMFINVSQKSNETNKEEVKPKSCLECVKGILKEKESDDPYPQELLCAAVEFIHALWAGHQALAMEALKQDPQFWNLICGVLFTDKYFIESAGINAYVIRTLTLEVFYKAATRKGLDEHVKAVFNDIHSKSFLLQWSKHVHSTRPKSDFQVQILSSMSDDVTDTFALLTAWRDFLLIIAVYKPLQLSSDTKEQILANILEHFSKEIAKNNSKSLILLSELFLMLGSHWKSEFVKLVNSEDNNSIFNILNEVAQEVNVVHPREQLIVVSIAVFTLRMLSNSNIKLSKIKDWIVPCCQLLKKASVLVHQPLDPKAISGVLKLPIVIICLLNELIQESTGWLPVLKSCSVFPVLVSLLIKSLKLDDGMDLSHSIFTLFLTMASEKQAAETLCSSGFMPEVTLMLSETILKNPILERKSKLVNSKKKVSKQDVYFAHLRFITALLQTLGNYFLQDCWNFTGVHQEILHESLIGTRSSLFLENIQHAILTASFIHQLSFHQQMWKLEQPKTLQMLLMDICNCIHSTVAMLSKPGLLKYLVMHKKMPDSKLSPTKSVDAEILLRKGSPENENESSRDVLEVEQKLFELLCITLTVLKKYTPDIAETMSGYTIDYSQWQLFLNVNFSIPSVDQVGPISFGTILACVNMCLKVLAKNEKTPSPRKGTESSLPINRSFLMYILEVSLTILLSQSKVAFSHPELPLREKQLIKRELSAELNSMNITINRYLRRGPLSPAAGQSSTSPVFSRSQSTEFSFLKMISNLVEKLFK